MFFTHKKTEKEQFDELYSSTLQGGDLIYLGLLLARAAQKLPNHTALIFEGKHIHYRQLYSRAIAVSNVLRKKGVKARDRVILLLENSPEFYVGYFAIIQTGAVVVPLNIFLKERELAHILNDAKPALIITSQDFIPLLEKIEGGTPPCLMASDMAEDASQDEIDAYTITTLEPDEMVALLYTSGTTGFPKGVMLSSRNALVNVMQGVTRFRLCPKDKLFGVLPLFHSFAQNSCIWTPFFIGSTVILVRKIERRAIVEGLEQKPTCFLGVPALYGFLALLKTAQFDYVRCFVSGGDALPDKIRAAFELIYGRKICSGYGLTEASPLVAGSLDDETVTTSSVGKPLVGITWALKDTDGKDVAPGHVGELWIKGDNIMIGYYNDPQMTEAVLKDGWLRTGDLFVCDPMGKLVMSGRSKDIIKHKGFIIYPPEVENAILTHPNVLRVGVIGRADGQTGEVPVAFVQLKHEQKNIEKELRELCLKSLATYKVPRDFFCTVDPLATMATGKVDKKKLREQLDQLFK